MPKVVNYAARFEFLRRAAFAVVRDVGPHALSRYTIAAALGTSPNTVRRLIRPDTDLRVLAVDEVERRRRHGRWGQPTELAGRELALLRLRRLLPDEEPRIAEELVWWRLVLHAVHPNLGGEDSPATLREDFALAEGTSSDHDGAAPTSAADGAPPAATLDEQRSDHDARVNQGVSAALAALGLRDEDTLELRRTRALVEGLGLAVCLGRTSPAEAVATLEHHLGELTPASEVAARVTR